MALQGCPQGCRPRSTATLRWAQGELLYDLRKLQQLRFGMPWTKQVINLQVSRKGAARAGELFEATRPSPGGVPLPTLRATPSRNHSGPICNPPDHSSRLQEWVNGRATNSLETLYKRNGKEVEKMKEYIAEIRSMFCALSDGEITISPYDTAWVALVPALDGLEGPEFPKSLQWIIDNQLSDGSWGDVSYFSIFDRVANTIACIVALKTWDTGALAVERGVKFIRDNLHKMQFEEGAHMPIGFEIVFPATMSKAKSLGLDLPYDEPVLHAIKLAREEKLKKIPMEILHKYPTTLLHSLEGVHEFLDWEKLLKLQSEDGSFLCSPAATACALAYTKDQKCLAYINKILDRFNNAVPNVYPVDLFEHMWMVDRIERLGIARYFQEEIKDCLDYVYRFWTSQGLSWARNASVKDVDDTAMGFRLLRQHGYDVSADVFKQFRGADGEFFCFAGQSGQAVTGMFNLYRAAQTRFPGETILEEAERFSRSFLEDKHAKRQCHDKWLITKNLEGEVGYALDLPWYCSLPRIENRAYLAHYGPDDIWIGKTFYRMPFVCNNTFLALAKADFNLCQTIHRLELPTLLRWNEECRFGTLPFARQKLNECYFSGVSHLPAPELAVARLVWARNCVLTSIIRDFFDVGNSLGDMHKFLAATKSWDSSLLYGANESTRILFVGFHNTVNATIQEGLFSQERDLGPVFAEIWSRWIESTMREAEWKVTGFTPSFDRYLSNGEIAMGLEPVVLITHFFLGEEIPNEVHTDPENRKLMQLVNRIGRICDDILAYEKGWAHETLNAVAILMREKRAMTVEEAIVQLRGMANDAMLELTREVHRPSAASGPYKQLHFNMARTVLLALNKTTSHSSLNDLKPYLIRKILFEPVA